MHNFMSITEYNGYNINKSGASLNETAAFESYYIKNYLVINDLQSTHSGAVGLSSCAATDIESSEQNLSLPTLYLQFVTSQ